MNQFGLDSIVQRGQVAILAYHRVVSTDDLTRGYIEPGMYVLRDAFEMQLRWFQERFEILSFSQLLTLWDGDEWHERRRYCVLTFDDGWLDNYLHAFPLLRKYQVPATIFLPTDYVGTNEWFWTDKIAFLLVRLGRYPVGAQQRRQAIEALSEPLGLDPSIFDEKGNGYPMGTEQLIRRCKSLPPSQISELIQRLGIILETAIPVERATINWDEVLEMAEHGISFGSHSCSHHLLTRLEVERIKQEIEESDRKLRTLPAGYLPVFCYPNGDNNSTIQNLVKQFHYAAAVGTKTGLEGRRPKNRYELRRVGMHNDVSKSARLLSCHLFRAACGF